MVRISLGHKGGFMTQEELNFIEIHPSLDQLGCKAMAKIVEPEILDVRFG